MKIERYEDKSGEHRWRAVADNGKVVADSGEGYKNASDRDAMVRKLFPDRVIMRSGQHCWVALPAPTAIDGMPVYDTIDQAVPPNHEQFQRTVAEARKLWMEENPCEDGHDHVTPFDKFLY